MKIYLNDMIFYGFHGVYPEERKLGQRFNVSLIIYTDDTKDENIKELVDTVDYTQVFFDIKQIMENQQFVLLEDCANTIIKRIFSIYELVKGVNVNIKKPSVSINGNLSSVGIEMERFKYH